MRKCYLLLLMLPLAVPLAARAQYLEAAGLSTSLTVTQTLARPYLIDMAPYYLDTQADQGRYDEIGYRLAAFGRWRLGKQGLFAQPEVAYTSTVGQAYGISYFTNSSFGSFTAYYGHRIRRWELAPLLGYHTGRRTYVLAGPLLALNLRETSINDTSGQPSSAGVANSLNRSVEPVQLLAQVGVGYTTGRFDFNLRLEQSLTPYTRQFTFGGATYGYRQQIRQGLFMAGFLLYRRKQSAAQ